ncbi:dihydroorotase [Cohnella abietis]|uniref:Allantoinase n=1 Tax=Cohnella abietis TaxID=2507935 RepID=A0A3T1DB60_9BACL|nr:amidohydrolase family protein [Cohnella abietis]BBI35333.1 allantoinase [Cohnella abietis]
MHNTNEYALIGNIVLTSGILYDHALCVSEGKIVNIIPMKSLTDAEIASLGNVIRADGCYVLPGVVDAHVHCYSALNEGFYHASRSAAAGGVTTVIEMPYDATGMICTLEAFEEKKQRLEAESVVDMAMLVTIHKEDGYDHIRSLAAAGACGFKVSMFNTDSFRFPRIDDGQLLDSFAVIAETGCPVGVHAETDEIVRRYLDKYKDKGSDPLSHGLSRPKVSESTAAVTAMELALAAGAKLHLYHCTFPRIFQLVEYYRSQGLRVTAETCTHYLVFSEEDMPRLKGRGKINPPLRSPEDVEGLWDLARSGAIDFVTSDHAPWLLDRKSNDADIFANASGAPGVEQLLLVLYSEGVAKGRLSISDLVRLLCENPAATFGLGHRKGKLAVGYDADFVVLDPAASGVLDERKLHSSAGWSPYEGMGLRGRVMQTYVRGKLVYDGDTDTFAEAGYGHFIPAIHNQ